MNPWDESFGNGGEFLAEERAFLSRLILDGSDFNFGFLPKHDLFDESSTDLLLIKIFGQIDIFTAFSKHIDASFTKTLAMNSEFVDEFLDNEFGISLVVGKC